MPLVNIKVAEKADPVIGKKRGRVKDTNGIIYQIPPALLSVVYVGGEFQIDYKDDSFNGHAFRVIESVIPAGAMSPQQQMTGQPYQPAAPTYNLKISGGSAGMPANAPTTKDEDISVLAIIKAQQLPVGDRAGLFHALKASALAWRDFKKWQRTQDSDMDGDGVP